MPSPMMAPTNKSGGSVMAAVLQLLLAAVLLLGGVSAAQAEGYPARPVRVVVGFPAGGPTDVIARMVAQKLSDALGQQFFVENIGGAGGNTASGQVARATPDGYTIMVISTGFVVNPSLYAKVPYDAVKYSFAGPGVGSTPHLGGELFRLAFSLDLVHVPFTGAAPAIQSTVGGHTPIAFTALP